VVFEEDGALPAVDTFWERERRAYGGWLTEFAPLGWNTGLDSVCYRVHISFLFIFCGE
jgi:hypothetical protein